jgi:choline monooxygenase
MDAKTSLQSVIKDVADANGLPNEHYIDQKTFDEEKTSVLFRNWSGIGFGKDVPDMGDVKPVDFIGMPLLIVRDKDGSIGVFQNTCRHRGMILVSQAKNIQGAIRCPYHSWCYALNGDLRSTPHIGGPGHNIHESIDQNELGLIQIRSYVWKDIIFVNIDGTAPEFEIANAHLLARWNEFDQPMQHGGSASSFELEVQSNWKLAVENYCESYHLPWIHPGLNSYSRLEDHYNIEERGLYSGQGSLVYQQVTDDNGAKLSNFENLSDKWSEGSEYVSLFPNVLLGIHKDHFIAVILEPVSFEKTIEHVELYYVPDRDQEIGNESAQELRRKNCTLWKVIFEEDIFVVEGMQKGRHGVLFDGGKFSPVMDGPTHNFHHWVATHIEQGRQT